MTALEIAQKYVYGEHDALTDNQEIIDMTKDIEQYHKKQLILSGVVPSACNFYMSGMDTSSKCNNCGKPEHLH